jgi:hypothetical protein
MPPIILGRPGPHGQDAVAVLQGIGAGADGSPPDHLQRHVASVLEGDRQPSWIDRPRPSTTSYTNAEDPLPSRNSTNCPNIVAARPHRFRCSPDDNLGNCRVHQRHETSPFHTCSGRQGACWITGSPIAYPVQSGLTMLPMDTTTTTHESGFPHWHPSDEDGFRPCSGGAQCIGSAGAAVTIALS